MTPQEPAQMPDVAYLSTTIARGGRNGVWSCLPKPKNSRKCEPRVSYTRTDRLTDPQSSEYERGWQTIESAPKDGPDIMLFNKDRNSAVSMSPARFWAAQSYPEHLRFFATHWSKMPEVA